jgi:nitrogen fixation/metabolism regulation signal transduction histidine kinase
MKRSGRLPNQLVAVFLAATLIPLSLTVWISIDLLDRSLHLSPLGELDRVSKSLERLGREYYQRSRDTLRADAQAGVVEGHVYQLADRSGWPSAVEEFWASAAGERFSATGTDGNILEYLERRSDGVRMYRRELGVGMHELTRDITQARGALTYARVHDLRRGFIYTFLAVASTAWLAGFAALVYFARRMTAPVQRLTQALSAVASGDLRARVDGAAGRQGEIGRAIAAFNDMAAQLEQSRQKLVQVTRLASWQALARKMAHEVKNSLTPIRLTMEEIAARSAGPDADFLRQAAQIVVDEVTSLERRVRAFSEFAAEPPVCPVPLEINAVVEERLAFLRNAHPEVIYDVRPAPENPVAIADLDLVKGVFTNLFENAAHAARAGGVVLVRTDARGGMVFVEVHDSGPGLSPQARSTVFEPTISFKKGGMGLGLSIARKSALLCGGDIALIEGELGGAGFRISLPAVPASVAAAATPVESAIAS